ncbi:hypothetical protein AcV5_008296 [Taiwanofungus camphoratus]|nr:hypothetical protein AcV5_008296 [Antrodia cinnamomea]
MSADDDDPLEAPPRTSTETVVSFVDDSATTKGMTEEAQIPDFVTKVLFWKDGPCGSYQRPLVIWECKPLPLLPENAEEGSPEAIEAVNGVVRDTERYRQIVKQAQFAAQWFATEAPIGIIWTFGPYWTYREFSVTKLPDLPGTTTQKADMDWKTVEIKPRRVWRTHYLFAAAGEPRDYHKEFKRLWAYLLTQHQNVWDSRDLASELFRL